MTKITRRAPEVGPGGSTYGSLEKDLSDAQLRLIGLVVLEWNEIEFLVQTLMYSALSLPGTHWVEIAVSMQLGPQKAMLLSAFQTLRIPEAVSATIKSSLDAAGVVKQSRDGVAHARVRNGHLAIGMNFKRSQDTYQVQETNLSEGALEQLHQHMKLIRQEIGWALNFVDMWKSSFHYSIQRTRQVPVPEDLYERSDELKEVVQQIQESQRRRAVASPPFPY